jgi:hypothetical protein
MGLGKSSQSKGVIQSIVFDKDEWNLPDARNWLRMHNFKTDVDIKENTYRFRQKNPSKFTEFYSKHIGDGITFVFGK